MRSRLSCLTASGCNETLGSLFRQAADADHCSPGPGSRQYRNAWLASQILRRLPSLCPAPWPYYHDLWFNRFGDECSIQFEWAFGATHDIVLGLLLDPLFGFSGEIALLEGQTLADCYSGAEYRVNIQYAPQPACSISLRRAVWEPADGDGAAGIEFGHANSSTDQRLNRSTATGQPRRAFRRRDSRD